MLGKRARALRRAAGKEPSAIGEGMLVGLVATSEIPAAERAHGSGVGVRYPAPTMRILILGGDGYLGWPTAMRFSARVEVFVVDNFSRRRWHHEHSTDSLTPIRSLAERIEAWREVSGRDIVPFIGSIEDGEFLDRVVAETLPEAVVHYGEQPRRRIR